MILSIPLAWYQLSRQKLRFLVVLGGITFIVVLMFMQLGFQDALYSSATQVHRNLKGDLFLISSQYKALTSQQSFPRSRLYQALAIDGAESVSPLYVQFAKFKNPKSGQKYPIYVLGFDPAQPVLNLSDVEDNINVLKIPNQVLFDRGSRDEFGPIAADFLEGKTVDLEIFPYNDPVGYRVTIGGLFKLGPSFGVDGNLVVSYSTILRIFKERVADRIDVGLITLKPGTNIKQFQSTLSAYLPKDVKVYTRQEFIDFEKGYWQIRTPIGFIFSLMVTMGFVIGVVVVYQILYTNIASHMVAYATLKAIGFKNSYLLNLVFQQAGVLAVFGYIPGFAISLGLYDVAGAATRLPIAMDISKMLIVFLATVAMCFLSAFFSMLKLRSVDPADVIF
jgi:putative ABC transport system permease protein